MIRIYNRKTLKYDIEKVAGEKYIKWTYESPLGKSLLELFIKRKLFSKIYGFFCNTKFSKRKIKSFINSFSIDMSKCADSIDAYKNFNDFFARKLLPEARPFDKASNILISPGDGRLLAYTNISMENLVQVKNIHYSLAELLEDNERYKQNLNLTYAVRDGIISHCGEINENGIKPRDEFIDLADYIEPNQFAPYTWEACVVKVSDKISYIGRDIEDAITLGILDEHLNELY